MSNQNSGPSGPKNADVRKRAEALAARGYGANGKVRLDFPWNQSAARGCEKWTRQVPGILPQSRPDDPKFRYLVVWQTASGGWRWAECGKGGAIAFDCDDTVYATAREARSAASRAYGQLDRDWKVTL